MVFKYMKLASAATALILSTSVNFANAALVFNYDGTVDPLTLSNWTRSAGASGSIGTGTELINGVNYDYWRVDDNTISAGGFYSYDLNANTLNFNNDWFFEASVRVIDAPIAPNSVNLSTQAVVVGDGLNYWSFYLANDILGFAADDVSLGMSQSLPGDYWNDYHTFAIHFSQNSAGTLDDTADFYIDGALVWNDVARSSMFSSGSSFAGFGGTSTLGTGVANYNYVSFNDGLSAVPVPAAVWLFGSGLVGLVGFARRKQA